MGMGTMMNPHGSVGIPWGFSNGFQITWKRVKYSAFFVICLTGISLPKNNKNVSYKYNANTIDDYKMTNNNYGLAKL